MFQKTKSYPKIKRNWCENYSKSKQKSLSLKFIHKLFLCFLLHFAQIWIFLLLSSLVVFFCFVCIKIISDYQKICFVWTSLKGKHIKTKSRADWRQCCIESTFEIMMWTSGEGWHIFCTRLLFIRSWLWHFRKLWISWHQHLWKPHNNKVMWSKNCSIFSLKALNYLLEIYSPFNHTLPFTFVKTIDFILGIKCL